ncbi:malonate--CoA ligase ACSF3, mitochondrial-like [Macrobrachium nipponense]|uniref:malonate--CoA ligase ACSF3, mitochondrial-like n=1 Tax=Macrobrachium nipponense TaxID=159736 RepID=UPI0030C879C2
MENRLRYCTNVSGLFTFLGFPLNPSEWHLFIDSSKRSFKPVLLHNGNKCPSIPIAHSVHLKESYNNMELILEVVNNHLAYLIQNLLEKGISQQRVAFLCPNDVSYIITQWATWIAGHIAVPLFPKHPTSQLEYYVRDSESSIIVTTSTLAGKIKPILSGQHVIVLEEYFFNENMESSDVDETEGNYSEDFYAVSDAMIIYTSGTTGLPKGTHKPQFSLYFFSK